MKPINLKHKPTELGVQLLPQCKNDSWCVKVLCVENNIDDMAKQLKSKWALILQMDAITPVAEP